MTDFANLIIDNIISDKFPVFMRYVGVVAAAFIYAFIMRRCEGWRGKLFTQDQVEKIKESA